MIEVGQDPRRFAEDLLRRLRDLIIVAAVPEALSSGLVDVAGDQAERLTTQATAMGAGELTRAAEVIAVGLTEMRGTTAPRLHLELMCARVLLPGADVDGRGLHARLDRLERRLSVGESPLGHGPPRSPPRVERLQPTEQARPGREQQPLAAATTALRRPRRTPVRDAASASQPSPPDPRAVTDGRRRSASKPPPTHRCERGDPPGRPPSDVPRRRSRTQAPSAAPPPTRRTGGDAEAPASEPAATGALAPPTSAGSGRRSSTTSRTAAGSPGSCSARTPRSSRCATTS